MSSETQTVAPNAWEGLWRPSANPNFYRPGLPNIPEAFSSLLSTYSKVPAESQTDHILQVRDQAYAVYPYPCLGRFRFTDLFLSRHPLYQSHILPILKSSATAGGTAATPTGDEHSPILLDIGCCLGQDLRKLIFDGVDPDRLYGSDLGWEMIDVGYKLFQDENFFGPREQRFIVPGDAVNDNSDVDVAENPLRRLHDRCAIVSLTSVFHLFDRPEQLKLAHRTVRLLDKSRTEQKLSSTGEEDSDGGRGNVDSSGQDRRGLIVGMNLGNLTSGIGTRSTPNKKRFEHNEASWHELWDEVLGADEWKDQVRTWEVGGQLSTNLLFWQEGRGTVTDSELGSSSNEVDRGVRWHVWWVWVTFR